MYLLASTSHKTDPSKELNLETTFSCGAVTEMISYNSSEQADHFTSSDLRKIRAWTGFFPSSGLSFRKKTCSPPRCSLLPASMDIKHMSPHFWKVALFNFITVCWIAFNQFSPCKKLLSALIRHMLKLHHMWIVRIGSGTLLMEGTGQSSASTASPYTHLWSNLSLSLQFPESPCPPCRTASTPSLRVA